MAIRKRKKKKEYNVATTMTYVPGLAMNNSTISIPKELIGPLPPKPTVSSSSKEYMPRWKAWFYYIMGRRGNKELGIPRTSRHSDTPRRTSLARCIYWSR
jgi:hypothetical protein